MADANDGSRWEHASREFMLARVAATADTFDLLDEPHAWESSADSAMGRDPHPTPERDRDMMRVPGCLILDGAAGLLGWAWNWREPLGGPCHTYPLEERAEFAAARGLLCAMPTAEEAPACAAE